MSDEPKKLYEVEITLSVYVIAQSQRHAENIVDTGLRDGDLSDEMEAAEVEATQVKDARYISGPWRDAYPYGGDGGVNCEQAVEAWLEWERTRPRTPAELEAAGQQRLGL